MRKILEAHIKTIDEKNHVRFFAANDIESIVFKVDKVTPKKPEPKKEDPPKESTAKKIVKKVTKKATKK